MPDPTYKILNQEFHRRYNPDGSMDGYWTVHVEHENGTVSTVEIPEQHYTAPSVHQVVMAQARVVDAVGKLPASVKGSQ